MALSTTRRGALFLVAGSVAWALLVGITRPAPSITLLVSGSLFVLLSRRREPWIHRARLPLVFGAVWFGVAIFRPHRETTGLGRLYVDQTYHHQVLRALNHAAAHGADLTEVLEATKTVEAGDADGWFDTWTALGDRSLARARSLHASESRGQALLRAHTYYLRAQFFLPPGDARRSAASGRDRAAFYEALDTLGVRHERVQVPYGSHHLNALYYPAASAPARTPLLVFCGGSDTTLEELYFFLAAAARARGYDVLTFEGPGQGAVLREQGLTMIKEWEKPTRAVLDAHLGSHAAPSKIVMIGLSLGGYLAARAAAFEPRIDGVVSYDVFFDGREVARRGLPPPARVLVDHGLGRVVDALAPLAARIDPAAAVGLHVGGGMFGKTSATEIATALGELRLDEVADRIHQDVLALAGEDDQFVPSDQIERYRRALVNARSVTTRTYDRASGGAEHSQLGATTLWQADLFDWLEQRFP